MMSAPAVIIAALNLTPSLRERLADEGELLTFADTEPIQALQTILEQRPRLIVLERLFAATPRGAALINRIKTDPQVSQAEIRVMSHTGDYTRVVSRGAVAEPAVVAPPSMRAAPSRRDEYESDAPTTTRRHAASARLAWHAAGGAIPHPPGRRDSARWQPGEPGRPLGDGRAGHLGHHSPAESAGPHQRADRRFRDALSRRGGVGQVRAAASRPSRRAIAPASSSPTPTRQPWTSYCSQFKL